MLAALIGPRMFPFVVAASFAFILVVLITPVVRRYARNKGYLDRPDSDRKLHGEAKPLGGGVAIFLATLSAVVVTYVMLGSVERTPEDTKFLLSILIGSGIVLATGVLDDITQMGGLEKLIGQLIAIGAFLCLEPSVERVELFGLGTYLGILSLPFTVFWLLGAINSINLLDGADGFATTVGIITIAAIAFIAIRVGHVAEGIVAISIVGALVGFLLFNFPPSSIFLGDAGSMLIGLLVGVLAMRCHLKEATTLALIGPVTLLTIPILDSMAAIVRRVSTGKNVFDGDHAHLHHVLRRRGLSPKLTVLTVAGLCTIPAVGTVLSVLTNNSAFALAGCAIVVTTLVTFSLFRTEGRLLVNRVRRLVNLLFFVSPPTEPSGYEAPHCMGLDQSQLSELIWDQLTSFATEQRLSRLRLELCGEWFCDGQDVICDQRLSGDKLQTNWRTRIPLLVGSRQLGTIELSAALDEQMARHVHASTVELIDRIHPQLEEIVVDRRQRDKVEDQALFINRSYWPDCEATGQLLTDLCEMVVNDLKVTVIAGKPNENPEHAAYVVGGVERRNGVTIRRVRHSRLPKTSIALRALNLVSFLVMATWEAIRTPRHDIVVVETDPFILALLGAELKRWKDCRLVVYVQDVYPDVAVAIGKIREGLLTKTLRNMLVRAYQRADKVIVLGDDMRERLISHGVDAERIVVIPNWVDTESVFPAKEHNAFRIANNINDKFVVMHSGNMGLTQDLEQLIEVADRMKGRDDIVFVIVGGGAKKPFLESEVRRLGLPNVLILPYQPRSELSTSLSAADLHVVSMHRQIKGVLVPSKLYGIMATGTPVLAIVPEDTDVAHLVTTEEIGFTVAPGDISQIAQTVKQCADGRFDLEAMGLRARKVAESQFDQKQITQQILALLQETLHQQTQFAPSTIAQPAQPLPAGKLNVLQNVE